LEYCKHDPDVRSWLYYYDDPDDAMDTTWRTVEPLNLENPTEGLVPDRTPAQIAVTEPEYFVESGLCVVACSGGVAACFCAALRWCVVRGA